MGDQPVMGVHHVGLPRLAGARFFSASPARIMAWPIASVQAIMSVPKPNSCGSCAAAITRTPSLTSSADGWVLGTVPVGRRRDDDLVAGRGERGRQVVDVPAETADHHGRVLPRHHQDLHRGSLRASSAPNRPSARFQSRPAARRLRGGPTPARRRSPGSRGHAGGRDSARSRRRSPC